VHVKTCQFRKETIHAKNPKQISNLSSIPAILERQEIVEFFPSQIFDLSTFAQGMKSIFEYEFGVGRRDHH
jgi:hypothetical protein